MGSVETTIDDVLAACQAALPSWRRLTVDDVDFDRPKGFSSFTVGVRAKRPVDPPAVLYRRLAGKQNRVLDPSTERATFLLLGDAGIAARCLAYTDTYRLEEFFVGRSLTADDVFEVDTRRKIAAELHRLHRLEPDGLPEAPFFELLHDRWNDRARAVLAEVEATFPSAERAMAVELATIHGETTRAMVRRCLPDREPVFCHNDTYHGNVFLLDDGSIRLLDFEFSCRNHIAFDFANLFAETVMVHGLADPPHFRIDAPRFDDSDLASLIDAYLEHSEFGSAAQRAAELDRLVDETRRAIMLSDYMYAMAALPLALDPIQRIRFIPYAHARFAKFVRSWHDEFGDR